MRSHFIVVATPDFDHDARFRTVAKPFHTQAFVAELAVEAFVGAVLPRFAGVDQRRIDLRPSEPFKDGVAYELRAIIGAQEPRCAVRAGQSGQYLDNTARTDTAGHVATGRAGTRLDFRSTTRRARRLPSTHIQGFWSLYGC